jgi:hypothetical protein
MVMAEFRLEPLRQFAAVHLIEVKDRVALAEQMPAGTLVLVIVCRLFRAIGSPVHNG